MIERPLVIVGAPRAGTTILQRCLALHPDLWHLRAESHAILEGPFHPKRCGYASNRVDASAVDPDVVREIRQEFYDRAINLSRVVVDPRFLLMGRSRSWRTLNRLAVPTLGWLSRHKKPQAIRLLEKTPKNTLRIPLLNALFPDALFLSLRRRAADNVDSLVAGWRLGGGGPWEGRPRYARAGYPVADRLDLTDYRSRWFKFALVPGWERLTGTSVPDVAAWQYLQCNRFMLADLEKLSSERVFPLRYEEFVARPVTWLWYIQKWAGLEPNARVEAFGKCLPRVNVLGAERRPGELREPETVRAAMERLPELAALREAMGYGEDPRWGSLDNVSATLRP